VKAIEPAPCALIFDLDGTLANTFPLIIESWNAAVREPLRRTFATEEVIDRFGIPDSAMLRRELYELPEPVVQNVIEFYHEHYEAKHAMVEPFEGVAEMLHALRQCGLPLGLMTGRGRRTADITISKLGWDGIFGSVITGEDIANQKPAPDGVLLVARQLSVEPQKCVFVGDSPADIEAGKAAGMVTIAVGWHDVYHDALRDYKPDYWAETPLDVARLCSTKLEALQC
jgi:2-phosphoglycolate phosphatase